MGLYQKFVGNTRKPDGLLGKLMVAGMNVGHAALAEWGCCFLGEKRRPTFWISAVAAARTSSVFSKAIREPA